MEVKVVASPKKADRFFSELNYVVPREELQVGPGNGISHVEFRFFSGLINGPGIL